MSTLQNEIPIWLRLWMQQALIGAVYPSLRGVAVGYYDDRSVTIRYYIDRPPSDFDHEVIDILCSEVLSNTSSNAELPALRTEVIFSEDIQSELPPLSGFVFKRMEGDYL
jgi:hypothetical protein